MSLKIPLKERIYSSEITMSKKTHYCIECKHFERKVINFVPFNFCLAHPNKKVVADYVTGETCFQKSSAKKNFISKFLRIKPIEGAYAQCKDFNAYGKCALFEPKE